MNLYLLLSIMVCLFSNNSSFASDQSGERQPAAETELSKLKNLEPFSEVAVIQKRFLPKTDRFEITGGLTTVMNDAFFATNGILVRFGYSFAEFYGLELTYMTTNTSERKITTDLRQHSVQPKETFVFPKSYMGLAFKWAPVYGKIAFLERKLIPYDLFFYLGYGQTVTNQSRAEPTLQLGFGQIFALSKDLALRWDFAYHQYQAVIRKVGTTTTESTSETKNIFVYLGVSYFFPEAKYR